MRVLVGTLIGLLVVAVVGAGVGVWTVRRSFAQYDGVARLGGLSAPVTVYRDDHGVPQIYAHTAEDLYRAQGYVHAQERFWEMDFHRHVTAGRLSELFGSDQVATDTYLRTMGWRRVARQEWDLLSPDSRTYLTAYADGVNAWLRDHNGSRASLEYAVLGLRNSEYPIEPWTPVDSLAWLKAMAWDLRGNMSDEIDRAALLGAGLTRAQVEQLYPAYPFDRNTTIVAGGTVAAGTFTASGASAAATGAGGGVGVPVAPADYHAAPLDAVSRDLARIPTLLGTNGTGIGSNSWVIAGSRTATGKPILANDPHLGPSAPSVWFQIGLHCDCGLQVEGFSFSGLPGVVIGHNDRIAWGFTNLGPDVTDLYLEKVDGDRYLVDGQWRDLSTRKETIKVAGGKPVTITVRTGKDGPLLSDASAELRGIGAAAPVDAHGEPTGTATKQTPAYAVALRWTALDPGRTADALFALDAAHNWSEFRKAASQFDVPAQNLIYADVDGNIGYQSPGRIPVRGKGDGRWPAAGWDSSYEWKSFIPFDALPSVYNPAAGYIVTANQAVIGPSYPYLLTDDWAYGYRAGRIKEMIDGAGKKVSVADVTRMQLDARNGMAPTLVPLLLEARVTGAAAKAQALLRGWDFQQPADGAPGSAQGRSSAAAAYYNAVWRHLLSRLFDELPADQRPDGNDRWFEVVRGLIDDPSSAWWASNGKPTTREEVVAAAMRDAADELSSRLGADPAGWRWGALHRLTVRNQTFGTSGIAPVEWLFNVGPVRTSGGSSLVDATGWNAPDGYDVIWVPSMRMAVDLSDLNSSRWVQLLGQSGHAFSPHYSDQLELWRTGKTLPMRWDRATIERESRHKLVLQ
ncbi:penicillin acylase family protein [Planosporangium thailandense]|uniref:Penicillin acylase family protein n=1 Tax=Planosporangium thailandense TaxID=765197 RepID=A0ABX0XUF0_9ACTN|nr:penicillin acylase family protein [Planosporangium thailandense]